MISVMKGAIDGIMNVPNETKVLLTVTPVNYFHVRPRSRGLPRRKISEMPSKGDRCTAAECRADEYTFDRLVYELAILSTNNGFFWRCNVRYASLVRLLSSVKKLFVREIVNTEVTWQLRGKWL